MELDLAVAGEDFQLAGRGVAQVHDDGVGGADGGSADAGRPGLGG